MGNDYWGGVDGDQQRGVGQEGTFISFGAARGISGSLPREGMLMDSGEAYLGPHVQDCITVISGEVRQHHPEVGEFQRSVQRQGACIPVTDHRHNGRLVDVRGVHLIDRPQDQG